MLNFDDASEKVTGNDNKECCLICHPLEIVNTEVISTFPIFTSQKFQKSRENQNLKIFSQYSLSFGLQSLA